MNETITFTQVKSGIGSPEAIRATLVGLGLTKMYKTVTRKNTLNYAACCIRFKYPKVKMEA